MWPVPDPRIKFGSRIKTIPENRIYINQDFSGNCFKIQWSLICRTRIFFGNHKVASSGSIDQVQVQRNHVVCSCNDHIDFLLVFYRHTVDMSSCLCADICLWPINFWYFWSICLGIPRYEFFHDMRVIVILIRIPRNQFLGTIMTIWPRAVFSNFVVFILKFYGIWYVAWFFMTVGAIADLIRINRDRFLRTNVTQRCFQ